MPTDGKGERPESEAVMGGKKVGIHELVGPRSQVGTAEMKSYKRGDVQKARKVTESATGGRRPVIVTGKNVHNTTVLALAPVYE